MCRQLRAALANRAVDYQRQYNYTKTPTSEEAKRSAPKLYEAALKEVMDGYEPMPSDAVTMMLDILSPTPGTVVLDPGCGDGRLLIDAVKRFGARGVGIEINPKTYGLAVNTVTHAGYRSNITLHKGDSRDLSFENVNAVVMFLYPELIRELEVKFEKELPKGAKVLSYNHPLDDSTVFTRGAHRVYLWVKE